MLTPDFISKVQNNTNSGSISNNKPMNEDQFNNWLKSSSTSTEPKISTYQDKIGEQQKAGVSKIGESITTGAKNIEQGTNKGGFAGAGQAIQGVAQGAFGTITGAAQAVMAPITPAIESATKAVTPGLRKLNPELAAAYDMIAPKVSELAEKHPEAATLTGDIVNTLLLSLGGKTKLELPASPFSEAGIQASKETLGDIATGAKGVLEKGKNVVKNVPSIKGSTEAKVLSTPESQVHKLSAPERKLWFDAKQNEITSKHEVLSTKIKENLKTQGEVISKSSEDLQKELATASRDKVIELRPKIIDAMGKQSRTYRKLVDEEMAGKESIPVRVNDLKGYVDSQFGDNPAVAQSIKDKLGLNDVPQKPLKKGEIPTIQTEEPSTTIGDIFNKTRELRQDISSGATKGNRTFTPEDVMTDKAINTLTSFLKTQGVDFSEANQFWARYAPIRDQLVSESKPFLQTGTKTKQFAQTLTRVAKETDINNENFINHVENLIGEPITKEGKAIVEKLNQNEKMGIASKVEAEKKLIEANLMKDKELAKLSSKEFEIEKNARFRGAIKKIIFTALGIGVAEKLGVTKMIGL